jgi:phosphate transport system protein
MLDKLLGLAGSSERLLDEAKADCLEMIRKTREMYRISTESLRHELTDETWNRLTQMDQEVNRQQMQVRKKVFSHLAVARARDLLTGLQLVSVVVDVERVGDYTKNIGELAKSTPGSLDFSPYDDGVRQVEADTQLLFDLVHEALAHDDASAARDVMERYRAISLWCDRSLEEILIEAPEDGVDRSLLILVLHIRYLKRVGAHLKNAVTVVVNPYHRIGYEAPG